MIDQYPSIVIFHGREQSRQHHGRIRRPVAIVPAVQLVFRTVDRNFEVGDSARAKHNLLAATLMNRTITDEPDVGAQQIFLSVRISCEMRRACFLLAFEHKLNIRTQRDIRGVQRIESGAREPGSGLYRPRPSAPRFVRRE